MLTSCPIFHEVQIHKSLLDSFIFLISSKIKAKVLRLLCKIEIEKSFYLYMTDKYLKECNFDKLKIVSTVEENL